MKVIDVLNKIANGEEVIAKHKLFDLEFFNSKDFHIGYGEGIDNFTLGNIIRVLNDEVEIIEEDKKIERIEEDKKISNLIYYNRCDFDTLDEFVAITTRDIFDKINELIDYLNNKEK